MRKRIRSALAHASLAVAFTWTSAAAQAPARLDVQLHAGKGDGYVRTIAFGLDAAANITHWLSVQGSVTGWRPFNVDCLQVWPGSYACSFQGNSATVGARVRFVERAGFDVFGVVGVGLFHHTDQLIRETIAALPIQVGGHIPLSSTWFVVAGWRRMWIFDEDSQSLLGEQPRYTAVTIGIERRIAF